MSAQDSRNIENFKIMLVKGADGRGIESIEKTSTSGIYDTYTITYDDGSKTTYTIANGNGITSVDKTGTSGNVDTYTITFDNGMIETFEVTNGFPSTYSASNVTYDNTSSGLSATRAQNAFDEIAKPTFTEASSRANIASGEKLSTIFGKIKKFFTDLKTVAFSGSFNDLSDKPTYEKVLWTRPDITTDFSAGTINNLRLNNFDVVKVQFYSSKHRDSEIIEQIIPIYSNAMGSGIEHVISVSGVATYTVQYSRAFKLNYTGETYSSIYFYDAKTILINYDSSGKATIENRGVTNGEMIPYKIIGVKYGDLPW